MENRCKIIISNLLFVPIKTTINFFFLLFWYAGIIMFIVILLVLYLNKV